MRETIGAVVRKPVFRIKLIAISLLFVVSLIEQVSNNYIQSSGQQVGRMTVILLLMHTFSYFSFYLSVFFVGYILLIPDIVKDAFIERQTMMRCQSRMRAAKYAIAKIIAFSILYVIWFVMLTILVGGIWFHDFSLAWPKFMDIQQRQLAANGLSTITWINIPVGAGKYPTLLVAGLICLRSTIGVIFLGLLALLVTLITGKTRNGMGIVILLAAIAGYVKLYMNDVFTYWNSAHPIGNKRSYIRISKATITPLFTTCLKSDEFMPWMRYGIIAGILLCVITGAGIMLYYRKGDLGDEDRDE